VIARKKGSLTAAEEVLLDESERAPQSGHYSVGSWVRKSERSSAGLDRGPRRSPAI